MRRSCWAENVMGKAGSGPGDDLEERVAIHVLQLDGNLDDEAGTGGKWAFNTVSRRCERSRLTSGARPLSKEKVAKTKARASGAVPMAKSSTKGAALDVEFAELAGFGQRPVAVGEHRGQIDGRQVTGVFEGQVRHFRGLRAAFGKPPLSQCRAPDVASAMPIAQKKCACAIQGRVAESMNCESAERIVPHGRFSG